jgi:large subunit ribosomal protein L5e
LGLTKSHWYYYSYELFQNLADEEPEKYQAHFSEYIKKGIEADDMEALYKKVHAAIRANPSMAKSTKTPPKEHKRYTLRRWLMILTFCIIYI